MGGRRIKVPVPNGGRFCVERAGSGGCAVGGHGQALAGMLRRRLWWAAPRV